MGGFECHKRIAKQRALPAHYQTVVLAWLILAFLFALLFKVLLKRYLLLIFIINFAIVYKSIIIMIL